MFVCFFNSWNVLDVLSYLSVWQGEGISEEDLEDISSTMTFLFQGKPEVPHVLGGFMEQWDKIYTSMLPRHQLQIEYSGDGMTNRSSDISVIRRRQNMFKWIWNFQICRGLPEFPHRMLKKRLLLLYYVASQCTATQHSSEGSGLYQWQQTVLCMSL